MKAIIDIKQIVEDCRSNTIGGLLVGMETFDLSVVPFLLNNSETWDFIPNETMTLLWHYFVNTLTLFWYYIDITLALICDYFGITLALHWH